MKKIAQIVLVIAFVALATLFAGLLLQESVIWQPAAVIASVSGAIGMGAIPGLKSYRYTAWIITAVVCGMIYPSAFLKWGDFDLRNKWLILFVVQVVMFGMGTQMSLRDFSGLATTGRGVAIGLMCQFTIMPLMALLLVNVFTFEPEIAAGVILIGSCSSGLASNVMTYLARGNLMLSVVLTAMATLLAPFLTPLLMKLLAGAMVEVKFINMMLEIIKIVIIPIGAALLHDALKTVTPKLLTRFVFAAIIFILILIAIVAMWSAIQNRISSPLMVQFLEILAFLMGAFVVGVFYHLAALKFPRVVSFMPYVSMFGIVYFTTVTTAAGRENLLQVGFLLFLCSVLHNAAGYLFGYLFSRLFGMDKSSCRTIAFEVGLQNGGMASGLAGAMGKLGTMGLAAAVFSPWMNISGSILANYWRKKSLQEEARIALQNETNLKSYDAAPT